MIKILNKDCIIDIMIISIKNNRHTKFRHQVKPERNSVIAKHEKLVLSCIPLAHIHYKVSKTNFEGENCPNYILQDSVRQWVCNCNFSQANRNFINFVIAKCQYFGFCHPTSSYASSFSTAFSTKTSCSSWNEGSLPHPKKQCMQELVTR